MKGLRKLELKKRLFLSVTVVIVVAIIVAAVGVISSLMLERSRNNMLLNNIPDEVIIESSRQQFMLIWAIIGVVLIVGIIIIAIISSNIARSINAPIQRIVGVVEQVGTTGEFSFPEELKQAIRDDGKNRDEVGRLSKGFAMMMDGIMEKAAVLEIAATGDLTERVNAKSDRDTLANTTNTLVGNLNTMASEVRIAIDQMGAGIFQISQGAQSLAKSTLEQSRTMERLVGTLGEISDQAADNAKHSREASDIATGIWSSAEDGRESMDKMTNSMAEINEASQSIGTVMKVIDDIAFQTNILSLNAAVEAARAGQHGKGFAVVADEVRSLATKSALAAKDSAELVSDTIAKSGAGSEIVKDTSGYLDKIMNSVSESTWLLKNIATATAEQHESIEAINKGFSQLADVVHQNSATAEQSAAATQQMSSQAEVLLDLVNRFKTEVEQEVSETAPVETVIEPVTEQVMEPDDDDSQPTPDISFTLNDVKSAEDMESAKNDLGWSKDLAAEQDETDKEEKGAVASAAYTDLQQLIHTEQGAGPEQWKDDESKY